MDQLKIQYRVEVKVRFTSDDIEYLISLSQLHYDARCKSLSGIEPKRGLLQHIALAMSFEDKVGVVDYILSWDDVDILCKLTELEYMMGDRGLRLGLEFRRMFCVMRAAFDRVNA